MSELELFDHLVSMNPVMGPTKDAIVKGTHKKHRYLMPKWMTGRSDDFYSGQPTTYLATLGIPLQIWYDIVYLGLRSINDRPKCSVCKENYLPFCGTRGYALVCSKKCHKETIYQKQIRERRIQKSIIRESLNLIKEFLYLLIIELLLVELDDHLTIH